MSSDLRYWGIKDTPSAHGTLVRFLNAYSEPTKVHAPSPDDEERFGDRPTAPHTEQCLDGWTYAEWILFVDDVYGDGSVRQAIEAGDWGAVVIAAEELAQQAGFELPAMKQLSAN